MENRLPYRSRGGSGAGLGILLITAGFLFLAFALTPVRISESARPLYVILPGLTFIAVSLARRVLAWMAIPGAMLTVVGLVMVAEQSLSLSSVWSYAWPLVFPGAVGLGVAIQGIVRRQPSRFLSGLWAVVVGIGMCAFFATFFAGVFGAGGMTFGPVVTIVFPVFLIAFGFALLTAALLDSNRRTAAR